MPSLKGDYYNGGMRLQTPREARRAHQRALKRKARADAKEKGTPQGAS